MLFPLILINMICNTHIARTSHDTVSLKALGCWRICGCRWHTSVHQNIPFQRASYENHLIWDHAQPHALNSNLPLTQVETAKSCAKPGAQRRLKPTLRDLWQGSQDLPGRVAPVFIGGRREMLRNVFYTMCTWRTWLKLCGSHPFP